MRRFLSIKPVSIVTNAQDGLVGCIDQLFAFAYHAAGASTSERVLLKRGNGRNGGIYEGPTA
jgi:hypothetical protein